MATGSPIRMRLREPSLRCHLTGRSSTFAAAMATARQGSDLRLFAVSWSRTAEPVRGPASTPLRRCISAAAVASYWGRRGQSGALSSSKEVITDDCAVLLSREIWGRGKDRN
jgi:hypothetical protein